MTQPSKAGTSIITPPIAWAGSKSNVMTRLVPLMPSDVAKTIEPLAGGAAWTLAVNAPYKVIADTNPALIAFYETLRDTPDYLIDYWQRYRRLAPDDFATAHRTRNADWQRWEQHYRNMISLPFHTMSPRMQGALFFFLNHTCFNGLWRVNSKGIFNVPPGFLREVSEDNLRAASRALQGALIVRADVVDVLECTAAAGDMVYLDPPYSGSFTGYTRAGWTAQDDARLAACVVRLTARGVRVMISASAASGVADLYPGLRQVELLVKRNISAKKDQRGHMAELVLMNY